MPLGDQDRAAFRCGNDALDRYFLERASRDVRERISAVFILIGEHDPDTVLGYYTLCSQEIDAGELPLPLRKKLGNYKRIPATLIGRLARDLRTRGQGIGEILLLDALRRALDAAASVMSYAVVVDLKEGEDVLNFYQPFGFQHLTGSRWFLPMKTVENLFKKRIAD
jgi:GNAT superfamily N-acetyltransferase